MPDKIITKPINIDQAVALRNSNWWQHMESKDIVKFQLFIGELSMPFDILHTLTETVLGRPIYPYEFGPDGRLQQEFLGLFDESIPSFDELVLLLPEDKKKPLEE